MNERLTRGILAGLSGILMAVALLWLGAAALVGRPVGLYGLAASSPAQPGYLRQP